MMAGELPCAVPAMAEGDCPVLVMMGGGLRSAVDGGGGRTVLPTACIKADEHAQERDSPACMHACMAQPATVRDPAHRK